MDFGLSEEQKMIVETVRSFVENEIYPHENLVEQTGEVPRDIAQDIIDKTRSLGFYACNFPLGALVSAIWNLPWLSVNLAVGRWHSHISLADRKIS